jgi:ubiquinone/menaquinone biosynthesis C-methylase UbiE
MNPEEYERMYHIEDDHWWYAGMRNIVGRALSQWHSPNGGLHILDAGCGTGGNLSFLAPWGEVTGVDLSNLALTYSRRRGHSNLLNASVEALPFSNGQFDLVTSFEVIYHLDVDDDVTALKEMRRVLKPEGMLLLRAPALEVLRGRHDLAVHTRERYSADKLRRQLIAAGFSPERMSYVNTLLLPFAAGKRLLERIGLASSENGTDLAMPPKPINAILKGILSLESRAVSRVNLPLGLSLLCLARAR